MDAISADDPSDASKRKDTGEFAGTGYLALFPRLTPSFRCRLFCLAAVSHIFLSRQLLPSQVEKMVGRDHGTEKQGFKQIRPVFERGN